MEYRIDMVKIFTLINSFINDTFSCDYRQNIFKINGNLNIYYKNLLATKSTEFIAYLKQNSIVCSAKSITLNTLTVKDGAIDLQCSFILDKVNPKIDSKQYTCNLTLIKIDNDYEIKNIILSDSEGFSFYGFHLVDLLKNNARITKPEGNKITLALTVRNEADRFLRRMLNHAMRYVSEVVILDDASTDNTIEVCEEILKDFPHKIYKNFESMMMNLKEGESKKKLWELTIKENPDWILLLDADEIFEDWGVEVLPQIINDANFDAYYFRIYHMWEDEQHYRVDGLWRPVNYIPFLVRYQPNYEYKWENKGLHCTRYPNNVVDMPGCYCYVRLKHYGHFTKDIRRAKYEKYKALDPNGTFESKSHYDSIIEENPTLENF